jgi:hypothetical protein
VTIGRARPVLSAKFRSSRAMRRWRCGPGRRFAPREFVLMDSQLSPRDRNIGRSNDFAIGAENPLDVRFC